MTREGIQGGDQRTMNIAHHHVVSVWSRREDDKLRKHGGLRISPQRAKGAGRWWARKQVDALIKEANMLSGAVQSGKE